MTVTAPQEPARDEEPANGDLDLVRVYLDGLGWHSLLSHDDEVRLAQCMERGNRASAMLASKARLDPSQRADLGRAVRDASVARVRFANANLRLVVSIAKGYQHRGVDLADLIQEGNIALLRAVDRFDWRRGCKFSTYATWWIRKAMIQALSDAGQTVRLPRQRREQARTLVDAAERLERRLGRPPGRRELAEETGMHMTEIDVMERALAKVISLSSPVDGDGSELGDLVADPRSAPEGEAVERFFSAEIEVLLSRLSPPAERVLRLRYGIGDGEVRTTAEVAAMLHVSSERVRQIEVRALSALRHQVSPMFWAS